MQSAIIRPLRPPYMGGCFQAGLRGATTDAHSLFNWCTPPQVVLIGFPAAQGFNAFSSGLGFDPISTNCTWT